MIGGRIPLAGRKPGNRRVRVERPHTAYFRYAGPGQLVAKPSASAPRTKRGRILAALRQIVIGRPLSIHEEITERLSKVKALAIFSSDAISSSAYATEEILRVLVLGGAAALSLSIPVAIAVVVLLAIVATSYRQIGYAYPAGGGAYAVARANLPIITALVAAAALLVDYVMTVAVSTASAVEQVVSALPDLASIQVPVGVTVVSLIALGNLRGLRESGNIFAVPTYLFVGSALAVIGVGLARFVAGGATPTPPPALPDPVQPIGILLVIRAFAAGSVALTGTEAIANGVPAFKPPEARNAAQTLTAMAVLLGVVFLGITVLASLEGIVPVDKPAPRTVVSQVAAASFGDGSPLFYVFQGSTALILFLAANTSYNGFPRLAAILARDGYMPRQFAFRGDRLAFTTGIVLLSLVAITLLVVFHGSTHALIPLYSIGVFISFTISQVGMVHHWRETRGPGWRTKLATNALGAATTGLVAVVVLVAKAPTSLLVAIVVPSLVGLMLLIKHQYDDLAARLTVPPDRPFPRPHRQERAIVPIWGIDRSVVQAVNVARSITDDVRAALVSDDPEEAAAIRERWLRQTPDVPLVVVESPYRAIVGPLLAYLDVLDAAWPPDKEAPITFVVVPEFVATTWWDRLLHNQPARRLRAALLGRRHTVVVDVPYRRDEPR
ncbi:MAG: amino acid permease [Chloroflexota bacterium]